MCLKDRALSLLQMGNTILRAVFSLEQTLRRRHMSWSWKEVWIKSWAYSSMRRNLLHYGCDLLLKQRGKLRCLYREHTWGLKFGLEKRPHWRNENLVKASAWWLICDLLKIAITHSLSTCTAHSIHSQSKMLWRGLTFKWQNPWIYLEIICWNGKPTLQDTAMNYTLLQSYSSVNHACSTLVCVRDTSHSYTSTTVYI